MYYILQQWYYYIIGAGGGGGVSFFLFIFFVVYLYLHRLGWKPSDNQSAPWANAGATQTVDNIATFCK